MIVRFISMSSRLFDSFCRTTDHYLCSYSLEESRDMLKHWNVTLKNKNEHYTPILVMFMDGVGYTHVVVEDDRLSGYQYYKMKPKPKLSVWQMC